MKPALAEILPEYRTAPAQGRPVYRRRSGEPGVRRPRAILGIIKSRRSSLRGAACAVPRAPSAPSVTHAPVFGGAPLSSRPRLVMTAGHCVYSPTRRLLGGRPAPARISVTPGRAGTTEAPHGRQEAARWYAHARYLRTAARPFDLGLIRLHNDVPGVEPFRLHAARDPELRRIRQTRLLHISGYPADKPKGTQWEHEERLDRSTARDLFHSIDTCPGQWRARLGRTLAGARTQRGGGAHCRSPPPPRWRLGMPARHSGGARRGGEPRRPHHRRTRPRAPSFPCRITSPLFVAVGEAASQPRLR